MTFNYLGEEEKALGYWRLAEELSLQNAALLVLGLNPENYEGLETRAIKPAGYIALLASLVAATRRGSLLVRIDGRQRSVYDPDGRYLGEEEIAGSVDPSTSCVDVEALITWLKSRGHTTGFFFEGGGSVEPYLDPNNERYSPKLAAAVKAWIAAGDAPTSQTPKQQIMKWLRENAVHFGLTDEDGKLIDTAIESISTIANWAPKGGAPKTKHEPPPPLPKPGLAKAKAGVQKHSFVEDWNSDVPF